MAATAVPVLAHSVHCYLCLALLPLALALMVTTPSSTALPLDAGEDPFCKFAQDSDGWWLACPGAGLNHTLTMGVNHVENSDRNVTTYGENCPWGTFGPPRYSALLGREVCPWFCDSFDMQLNTSLYARSTKARYGNTTAWAQEAARRLRGWGFNTVGDWSSPLLTGDRAEGTLLLPDVSPQDLLYAYQLDMLMTPFEHRFAELPLVDVFDPNFKENCSAIAKRHASPRRNDQRLLGYWLDNELAFNPNYRGGGDLVGSSLRCWTQQGQGRVVAWLSARYNGSLEAFNAAWGTHLATWGDIPALDPLPNSTARHTDNLAFVTHYVDSYLGTAVAAVRAVDPNHMVLGSRYLPVAEPVWTAIMQGMAAHVAVVDVHCYDQHPCTTLMEQAHRITGLPVLMSEFGFRARDSGLPNTKGAGPLVWTQTDRAAAFFAYIHDLVALPFVVGYHMFMYYDEPAGKQLFGADSNFGLVHQDDDPYQVLTEVFTSINADAPLRHAANLVVAMEPMPVGARARGNESRSMGDEGTGRL